MTPFRTGNKTSSQIFHFFIFWPDFAEIGPKLGKISQNWPKSGQKMKKSKICEEVLFPVLKGVIWPKIVNFGQNGGKK